MSTEGAETGTIVTVNTTIGTYEIKILTLSEIRDYYAALPPEELYIVPGKLPGDYDSCSCLIARPINEQFIARYGEEDATLLIGDNMIQLFPFAVHLSEYDDYLTLGPVTISIPEEYIDLGNDFDLVMGKKGTITYAACVELIEEAIERREELHEHTNC